MRPRNKAAPKIGSTSGPGLKFHVIILFLVNLLTVPPASIDHFALYRYKYAFTMGWDVSYIVHGHYNNPYIPPHNTNTTMKYKQEQETDNPLTSGRQEPPRNLRISTRENSAFKWKSDPSVVGALEVASAPTLDPKTHLQERVIPTVEQEFTDCLEIWKSHKLHKSLVEAISAIPIQTKCCGWITDTDHTIRNLVPLLNKGWAKKVSEEFFQSKGYRVSSFVWTWRNITGATENCVLLIRFHTLNECARHIAAKRLENRVRAEGE